MLSAWLVRYLAARRRRVRRAGGAGSNAVFMRSVEGRAEVAPGSFECHRLLRDRGSCLDVRGAGPASDASAVSSPPLLPHPWEARLFLLPGGADSASTSHELV